MDYDDDLQTFAPEYREALILLCPYCPHEYEVNYSSVQPEACNKCPECGYVWIVE